MTLSETTLADALRPASWDDYRGQDRLKLRLQVHIAAAQRSGAPLPHTLLAAPAGYGKTSLAKLIGDSMGRTVINVEMPWNDADVRALSGGTLMNTVICLDELHRLSKRQQEEMLPALEHGAMKPKGKPIIRFHSATFVGCTTEPEALIDPLRDRFLITPQFDNYTDEEMGQIVQGMAAKFRLDMSLEECIVLARACGGVPRKGSHLMLAAHDLAMAYGHLPTAAEVLEFCELEWDGMGRQHRQYLEVVYNAGDALGLAAIKNLLDCSEEQVRDVERLMLRKGYVTLTGRGREITAEGVARWKGEP